MTDVQVVEKLHAQTVWGDRRDHNKDLSSSNYMLDLGPSVPQIIIGGLIKVGK